MWITIHFMMFHRCFTENAPKEHRETLDREKMLRWQREREDDDRAWRDTQRNEYCTWRTIELIIFGIVAMGVGAGAAILGAPIERGSWP